MIAGLDLGCSLAKAVWKKEDKFCFASSEEKSLDDILSEMKKDGVKEIEVTGLGYYQNQKKLEENFALSHYWPDPIMHEIKLQASGTKKLLEQDGLKLENFLLVSIGTGTSYTSVKGEQINKYPFGNAIGGGFLLGFSNIMGFYSYKKFSELASKGKPLSLKFKDLVPQTADDPSGEFVIASLGRITKETEIEEICASMVECAAVSTINDILKIGFNQEYLLQDIVYVGSTIKHTPLLKEYLQKYSNFIGRNTYFPNFGEFAVALGAYYSLSETKTANNN